ncbi:shikimate O-hydroxycinnamoyltransferase-like [Heracleum sosnowskyi]|uniref:Shikimate O-hydroxycinnamoyltransferase-like n=1 Tax=Heracleum sosnowskyi TaxID=360622 RepID=A0AAD8N143_9APIA|nr:shikimate O-hydroxycinnamoyltransferase-like [Heracleum sosnowskyi]
MGSCEGGVVVVVKKTEVVAAVLPVTEHRLAMSNLDLLLPPLDVGIFFCYNDGAKNNEMLISMVRKGLGQALVSFPVLAGEVVPNNAGEPEMLCNNRGVDFVQAFADMELQHLDLYNPDVSVDAKFVPVKKHGVLSIQVTEMRCGGAIIGCSFDHRVADAHSINKFLIAWANMTRSNYSRGDDSIHPLLFPGDNYMNKLIPSYSRSLIVPREPRHHDSAIDNMYMLIKDIASSAPQVPPSFHLQSRIYQISAQQIQLLQSLAGPKRTKFESFSALLWKLLAKAAKEDKKRCKLGIVVNGRNCLSKSASLNETTMDTYFGNVLSVPYSDASVGELKSLPLSEIANLVHACVESAANEEHFRGLVDWVENRRPQPAMCKIYSCLPSDTEEVAVVVSSGQRFPVSKMDFGWGRPSFGSYHFPWGGTTGYVMPMPSARDDGDWIVYMHLFRKHLDFVEKEAPHIFKPFAY